MLPAKLHYQSKVEPSMCKSFRSNIQPQNGTGPYSPGNTIIFNLPTHNNLCFVPTESYLNFKANIINNSGFDASYYRLDKNGCHGFIQKLRVMHGTNVLEEIDNYGVLAKMIFDLQAPSTAIQGKLSITTGTRSDLSFDMPTILKSDFPDTSYQDDITTAFNRIPSRVFQPNHGQLLNNNFYELPTNTTFTTQLFSVNLISIIGTLCNEKYFPLFACTSAPLRLEITLVPNLLNAVCCDQAGTFTISDVEYVMNTIELSDSAMGIIQNSLNGEPLQFCVTDYKNYSWNGQLPNDAVTSYSVPINAKFSSLKSIVIASSDSSKSGGNKQYFPYSSNSFGISQYYFRIGSNVFPSKYPSNTSEYFSEVMKATGSLSDIHHSPCIDRESYNQTLPQVNNDSFTSDIAEVGGGAGIDTYKYSSVHSGSFYTGIDLENYATADRTNIFAGYNSNTDDIFYVPTYPKQTGIGNITFQAFAMYDAVLVFQNNTVYCKF